MVDKNITTIAFTPPTFRAYEQPHGWLLHDQACHALWYYYVVAFNNYREHIHDPIVLEGDKDQVTNFRQLFMSIAIAYGVEPERMVKFWLNVDMQCRALYLPRLPDEDKYRFHITPEIRTQ